MLGGVPLGMGDLGNVNCLFSRKACSCICSLLNLTGCLLLLFEHDAVATVALLWSAGVAVRLPLRLDCWEERPLVSPSLLSIRRSISGSKRMSLFLSIGLLRLFDLRSVRAAPDDEGGTPLELGAAAESRAAAEDEWWTGGAEVGGAVAVVAALEELLFDEEEPK